MTTAQSGFPISDHRVAMAALRSISAASDRHAGLGAALGRFVAVLTDDLGAKGAWIALLDMDCQLRLSARAGSHDCIDSMEMGFSDPACRDCFLKLTADHGEIAGLVQVSAKCESCPLRPKSSPDEPMIFQFSTAQGLMGLLAVVVAHGQAHTEAIIEVAEEAALATQRMADRVSREQEHSYQLAMTRRTADAHTTVAELTARLISPSGQSFEKAVQEALSDFGRLLNADRVLWLEKEPQGFVPRCEWVPKGLTIVSPRTAPRPVSLSAFAADFECGRAIVLKSLSRLPSGAFEELAWLQQRQARSVVIAPLVCNTGVVGCLSFETSRYERSWDEADTSAIRSLANILSATIQRDRLETSLRLQALVFAIMDEAVVIRDNDGTIREWNEAAQRIFGYSRDEAIGRSTSLLYKRGEADFVRAEIARGIARNGRWEGELGFVRKDGTECCARAVILPMVSDCGTPDGSIGLLRDVTSEMETHRSLKDTTLKLDLAVAGGNVGLWLWESSSLFSEINETARSILELADDVLPALSAWPQACHPDDSELLAEALEPVLRGDADSFSCEFRFNTGSRAWKWVRARGTSLGGGDAGALNISGTLVDIHDLRTAREQLAREHGLLRMIMDTSPVGIAVLSVSGGIPYISREAMKILGISPSALQSMGITDFEHCLLTIEGNDVPPRERPLRHALERPELFSGGRFLFDAGAGRRQPVFINAVSMRDSDGSPTGVLVTVEDIADKVNAESEVRYREEQLRHARNLEAVGRLASGIAHDFNNLMAIIVGRAEVLSGSMKADPARVSKLNDIRDSALAAGKLAQQMLSFSRAQVGTMRSIDLNRAISDFRESIDRVAGKQVRCVFDFEPHLHQVITDPSHINQLLLTFVLNARDAMPKGGELRISTRNAIAAAIGVDKLRTHNCRDTGDFVVLTFSDTGHGMSDIVKARIFEPFFTTKEVGKGVGLGLSAAYGMVRTAGGFIEFDSELGRGSTFRIVLPAVKREPAEQRQKPLAASNSVSAKVLVVDPDSRVRDFVVSALKAAGYTVRSTTDRDGVQTLIGRESFTPAAVVLDLSVPGVSDLSLTAELQRFVPGIRILYTTSKGLDDGASPALQPILAKPFGGAALVSELSRLLGQGND